MGIEVTLGGGAEAAILKIGQVAERVGLSLRTLRYYEEVGLLEPTDRSPGGFRLYSENDVARAKFLKGMKPLGLSLEEIRELVDLLENSAAAEGEDEVLAAEHRASLERFLARADDRVRQLEAHRAEVVAVRERISAHLSRGR